MTIEYAIATAVDADYMKKLKWCLPTWTIKPQFRVKLYVFYHGVSEADLEWTREYFDVQLVPWDMPKYSTHRELMLSSFVLGAAKHIKEDAYIKLDADCYFTDSRDAFTADDMNSHLCAHRWGYSKPGWWHEKMMSWMKCERWSRNRDNVGTKGHKRIISWCCWHRMDFVRACADAAGDRLPIPSHDTFLWHMADYFHEWKWSRVNLKDRGVNHQSRWRKIREDICSHEASAFNPYLNRELLKNVQLEITTACNRACPNCDRNCGTAPSSEHMTAAQVQKFVDESLDAGHQWNRIDVIGGEPTLHPDLLKILETIQQYKLIYPKCRIRLTTNGTGKKVKQVIATLPDWVDVRNSDKEKSVAKFDAVNCAPVDNGEHNAKSCSIPWRCGLALSRYGYYLCGAGASVGRVFGRDVGIKRLDEINPERLRHQRNTLCAYCGHSQSNCHQVTEQETSKSWAEAFNTYKDHDLEVY